MLAPPAALLACVACQVGCLRVRKRRIGLWSGTLYGAIRRFLVCRITFGLVQATVFFVWSIESYERFRTASSIFEAFRRFEEEVSIERSKEQTGVEQTQIGALDPVLRLASRCFLISPHCFSPFWFEAGRGSLSQAASQRRDSPCM